MTTNDTVTLNDAIWQTEFGEAWDDDSDAGCAGEGVAELVDTLVLFVVATTAMFVLYVV